MFGYNYESIEQYENDLLRSKPKTSSNLPWKVFPNDDKTKARIRASTVKETA